MKPIPNISESFLKLKLYCEQQKYKGWDPYDGLNSKIFQFFPLKRYDLARLVWIQGFKRSPINFRKLMGVPKEYNAKGIALFLSGYCNLYSLADSGNTKYGTKEDHYKRIVELSDLLLKMKNEKYSGASWGYNFDWQARRLFFFPKGTPTVVATCFCTESLLKSYEITKNENYLNTALSAASFVMNDLTRTPYKKNFLFSYSPLRGNNTVINASLLGAKILSLSFKYSNIDSYKNTAMAAVQAACLAQSSDGSWVYGLLPVQSWIDSFHTGYNLDAIHTYQTCTSDYTFSDHLEQGYKYYIKTFFTDEAIPKYYHNKVHPIDIHCPAQLFVTLSSLNKYAGNKILAEKTMQWTISHMQDPKGYFYYQLKKGLSSKISYMRWSNAFMFNAMSHFLQEKLNFSL